MGTGTLFVQFYRQPMQDSSRARLEKSFQPTKVMRRKLTASMEVEILLFEFRIIPDSESERKIFPGMENCSAKYNCNFSMLKNMQLNEYNHTKQIIIEY